MTSAPRADPPKMSKPRGESKSGELVVTSTEDEVGAVLRMALARGAKVKHVTPRKASLEDVFSA